ncbi:MAG TPA: hypothetical protein VIY48_21475, partial [Candidatus Paceibacterota bacterium]
GAKFRLLHAPMLAEDTHVLGVGKMGVLLQAPGPTTGVKVFAAGIRGYGLHGCIARGMGSMLFIGYAGNVRKHAFILGSMLFRYVVDGHKPCFEVAADVVGMLEVWNDRAIEFEGLCNALEPDVEVGERICGGEYVEELHGVRTIRAGMREYKRKVMKDTK